jgi:peptidoglycan/xylan/chitin deacetylase (PgdA/CDA1 family)
MVGRILTRALHGAGLILFYLGAAPLVRWLGRKSPKILLYHDCSPEESAYTAGLDCTTTPARFEQHLAYLSEHYAIVDIDTILAGRAPERAAAVTFDDGYASVYDHAFPALRKFDVPATVYLISSVVDNESLVWVNELNYFLHVGGEAAASCASRHFGSPATASPSEIISFCRLNYRPETMTALLLDLRRMMKLPLAKHAEHARLYLTWREIFEMRESGISFGNHSRTHANLERLTEDEQSAEIEQAQRELELKLGRVSTFAHPFGHHGPTTAQLAADAGLESVAEVGGHNRPVAPLRLGRTHIGHETVASLFARMEVVEPVKEMIRRAAKRGSRQSAPQIRQEVERTSG